MIMNTEHMEQSETKLGLLYEVSRKASSVSEVSNLVDQIMCMTERTLKASASSVLLLDEEKQELYFEFVEGDVEQTLKQIRINIEAGIAGWVARHRKWLIVNDVNKDHRFCDDDDRANGFVTRSIMCAPLMVSGWFIGVIEVLNRLDGRDFDE